MTQITVEELSRMQKSQAAVAEIAICAAECRWPSDRPVTEVFAAWSRQAAEIVRLRGERDELLAERHGPYRCCEHCAGDPIHAVEPNAHAVSCSTCDEVDRRRAERAEATVQRVRQTVDRVDQTRSASIMVTAIYSALDGADR